MDVSKLPNSAPGMQNTKAPTVKTEEKAILQYKDADWGMPAMTAKDLIIPYLSLQQASSNAVKNPSSGIKYGDFLDTRTQKAIAHFGQTFQFIALRAEKILKTYDVDQRGRRKKVTKTEVWDSTNDNLEYEVKNEKGQVTHKRYKIYKFYGLLPSDVAEKKDYPYVLSLESSSLKAGKDIFFQMNLDMGQKGYPCATVFNIGSKEVTKEDDKYLVVTVGMERPTNAAEVQACYNWSQKMKSSKVVEADGTDE